jgi:hypothetical protein
MIHRLRKVMRFRAAEGVSPAREAEKSERLEGKIK